MLSLVGTRVFCGEFLTTSHWPSRISRVGANEEKIRRRVKRYFVENTLFGVLEDPSRVYDCKRPKRRALLVRKSAKSISYITWNDELTLSRGASGDENLKFNACSPIKESPKHIGQIFKNNYQVADRIGDGWLFWIYYKHFPSIFDLGKSRGTGNSISGWSSISFLPFFDWILYSKRRYFNCIIA